MADDKTFSHITVSADDEDDVVIQAGVRTPSAQPKVADVTPATPAKVAEEKPSDTPQAAHEDPASAEDEEPLEQQLDDVSDVPLPAVQKAVLVVALLLVAAFVVYYFFLR